MGLFPAAAITVILLCCSQAVFLQAEKNYTIQFDSFDPSEERVISDLVRQNVTFTHNAMQLTPDIASGDTINFKKTNNSGRVFLRRGFRLWEGGDSGNASVVASFNSTFRINIYPLDGSKAEGITFLIASNPDLPENSFGQYLGLTNSSTDGNSTNKFVAVELDTNKQSFDPDDNHVGIDINGVRSVKIESLRSHGIVLAPNTINASFYNVWVQYDGVAKVMEVYIGKQETQLGPDSPKPVSPVLKMGLDLRKYLDQESYFGFSASTGVKYQLNCVLRWSFTIKYFPEKKDWWKIAVGVGVPVAVLGLIAAAWFVAYRMRKKRKMRTQSAILGALKSLPGTPREFEFKDLKRATDNFDEKNKLGQGGYGMVYKGCLAGENLEIAVKMFSRESIKGQDDFLAELTIINRLRHKHLVKLLGWCHKYGKLLLVYEYMPHGSLDKHLFSAPEKDPLSWELRYKIVSGVASALQYLHNEFEQRVVHRDLKASNIMLDSNFNARLGDFGLARALDNERTSYAEAEGVLGTMGYIAPECFHTGKATQQSDVYAFGAVLLEVVCGQRPGTKLGGFQSLVDWVWYMHRDGRILEAVDERLKEDFDVEEAKRLLLLGLACSHPIANERPRTSEVVQIILGSIPVPFVPPFKPAFVWPSMAPIDIDSTEADTRSFTPTSQFSSGWTPHCVSTGEISTGHIDSLV
ncbi:PREDICTED: probable L-type lectin-domain containing receptor kinase S.5 [Ipomoea nil]|uniref:probable L-type lectin-domain containing receptor kinase S.5 n=1 Tax=Ipomoea nil TaxID=35883 RepID=UPI000900B29D|nr:PREDICTED: probable L-type lectin-domain containing receptor kinase S.5 [Ipomoea nil]